MEKGSYTLIFELKEKQEIKIGALDKIKFEKGYYAYNGSAFGTGGLKRVKRHKKQLKNGETQHWHIDYLNTHPKTSYIGVIKSSADIECQLSQKAQKQFKPIKEFGSSDCGCNSHLLYSENLSKLRKSLLKIHKSFSDEVEVEFREKRKSKE